MRGDERHPLVTDYLQRLRRVSRPLPRSDRHELYAEIESHLAEATSATSEDAEVLNTLERLGEPAEIVAAHRPQADVPGDPGYVRERWAIVLLLLGGFAIGFGWLVGLLLLWISPVWTTRDKWIGTLILPGGLALAPLVLAETASKESCRSQGLFGPSHCTGNPSVAATVIGIVVVTVVMAAPLCTARYLSLRLK